jgi:hypothetical protein
LPQHTDLKNARFDRKQFVAAMVRNGFTKDQSLLNGFRHPDLPKPMFMTMLIQANGYRGALKAALESLKKAQASRAKADQEQ